MLQLSLPQAMANADTVVASAGLPASPDEVGAALITSEVERWWGSPETYRMTGWNADLRVGGSWRVTVRTADGRAPARRRRVSRNRNAAPHCADAALRLGPSGARPRRNDGRLSAGADRRRHAAHHLPWRFRGFPGCGSGTCRELGAGVGVVAAVSGCSANSLRLSLDSQSRLSRFGGWRTAAVSWEPPDGAYPQRINLFSPLPARSSNAMRHSFRSSRSIPRSTSRIGGKPMSAGRARSPIIFAFPQKSPES